MPKPEIPPLPSEATSLEYAVMVEGDDAPRGRFTTEHGMKRVLTNYPGSRVYVRTVTRSPWRPM